MQVCLCVYIYIYNNQRCKYVNLRELKIAWDSDKADEGLC